MAERLMTVEHCMGWSPATQAEIMRARFLSEGIPTFLADDIMLTMNPFYAAALGGVKVRVPQSHVEDALHIMAEVDQVDIWSDEDWFGDEDDEDDEFWEDPEAIEHEPRCPVCGSVNMAVKVSLLPNTLVIALLYLPLAWTRWFCWDCDWEGRAWDLDWFARNDTAVPVPWIDPPEDDSEQ